MQTLVFPAHPVSLALSRVTGAVSSFTRLAGVRFDLMDHKRIGREIVALRAELDRFEAVLIADGVKQRAEATAKRKADRIHARQLEIYLAKHPHERERAIRLGMKDAAHAAFVSDGLADIDAAPVANIATITPKAKPFFQLGLGRRKAA